MALQPPSPQKGLDPLGFYTLPTPDPKQFSFKVRLDANKFNPTTAVPPGTPYSECSFIGPRPRAGTNQGFDDYVYTYTEADRDNLWFYFGKKKSAIDRNVPFRTFWTNQDYTWPAVLEDCYFVESSFPLSAYNGDTTVTSPTLLPRYRYRPGVNVDSLCQVEQFLDAVPWTDADLQHDQPVPTDVNASYLGVSVDFPRCLHKALSFKDEVVGAKIIQGIGMITPPPGRSLDKMVFPATNFTDWTNFTLEDRQQFVAGLFLRERITIYPPAIPDSILR